MLMIMFYVPSALAQTCGVPQSLTYSKFRECMQIDTTQANKETQKLQVDYMFTALRKCAGRSFITETVAKGKVMHTARACSAHLRIIN